MISGVATTASTINGIEPSHSTSHQRRILRMISSAAAAIGVKMTRLTPRALPKSPIHPAKL